MREQDELPTEVSLDVHSCVMLYNEPTHAKIKKKFLSKTPMQLKVKSCVMKHNLGTHFLSNSESNVKKIGLVKGETLNEQFLASVNEVYDVNAEYNSNLVSWSSRVHPSVIQPVDLLKTGLYFFNVKRKNTELTNVELNFVNQLGLKIQSQSNDAFKTKENHSFALIYFGICDQISEYELKDSANILEVHKFTNNSIDNNSHLSWYKNDLDKSTINKLQFGNVYYIKYDKTSFSIPGAVVLNNNLLGDVSRGYCGDDDSHTPTPINTFDCCEDGHIKTILNNGIALDVNNISVQGNVNGVLCWTRITEWDNPKTFNISFNDDTYARGGLKITTTGLIGDRVFKFYTNENVCYEGKLDHEDHVDVNVWNEVNSEPLTPTPTPIISTITEEVTAGSTRVVVLAEDQPSFEIGREIVIDKDTAIEEENEVTDYGSLILKYPLKFNHPQGATIQEIPPTPTPTFKECCTDDSPNMILITEAMATATSPSGPSGITISGFQAGGKLCVGDLIQNYELKSCVFEDKDRTFSGVVTLSFELLTNKVIYETPDGKCYEGIFMNSVDVPQILTER